MVLLILVTRGRAAGQGIDLSLAVLNWLELACVASVPEQREQNSGRARPREGVFRIRAARKMGRVYPIHSFHFFALASFFVQPECEKTPSRGPNFVRVVRERFLRRLV